jgi:hypothetical protein
LSNGADTNAQDNEGETALMIGNLIFLFGIAF